MNDLRLSSQSYSALAKWLLHKMQVNVMKGQCNCYTRSARRNAPSARWNRLRLKTRSASWLWSGPNDRSHLLLTLAGNYEPREKPQAAGIPTLAIGIPGQKRVKSIRAVLMFKPHSGRLLVAAVPQHLVFKAGQKTLRLGLSSQDCLELFSQVVCLV